MCCCMVIRFFFFKNCEKIQARSTLLGSSNSLIKFLKNPKYIKKVEKLKNNIFLQKHNK
jgi:hypothetical protein